MSKIQSILTPKLSNGLNKPRISMLDTEGGKLKAFKGMSELKDWAKT